MLFGASNGLRDMNQVAFYTTVPVVWQYDNRAEPKPRILSSVLPSTKTGGRTTRRAAARFERTTPTLIIHGRTPVIFMASSI